MNSPTVSDFTNQFYISKLPKNTSVKTLVGYMIWAGPVSGVKFPINIETGSAKGYAVVTMYRRVPALASLELIRRKIGTSNPLLIATDFIVNGKNLTTIRNDLAEVISNRDEIDFSSANELLLEIIKQDPNTLQALNNPRVFAKMMEKVRSGAGISRDVIISIVSDLLPKASEKAKRHKDQKSKNKKKRRKSKKRNELVIIYTPMGGQPPKRRR